MKETKIDGFLPTAHVGPAWDEARGLLTRPHSSGAPLDEVKAGIALSDLHTRYAYTFDQRDLDDIMRFFTDDCVINAPNGTIAGTEAIRAHYSRILSENPSTFHLFTNTLVRIADDLRSGWITSYFLAVLQSDGQPPRAYGGLLADTAVDQNSKWKISKRSIAIDVNFGLTALPGDR